MSRFFECAREILETATASGDPAEATILITSEGGIRILSDSDWPLDRLVSHHAARSAYRVSRRYGKVAVEGRSQTEACRLESLRYPLRAGTSPLLPAVWG
ncbi:MAG TPA: hypothetical protein VN428_20465 [Bryobacteraceae bacterium]|nr:hypothetical protein [Bryobacteraceae bacterium]